MAVFVISVCCVCTTTAQCTLCLDGSDTPTPDKPIFSYDENISTCAEAATYASTLDPVLFACLQIQDVGLARCGCTTPPDSDMNCTLCADGSSAPNSELEIIPLTTCAGVERMLRRYSPSTCLAFQKTMGVQCGCSEPDPEEGGSSEVCKLCGDSTLPNPAGAVFVEELGVPNPCAFFEVIANDAGAVPLYPCEIFQYQGNVDGCCSTPPTAAPSAAKKKRNKIRYTANKQRICDGNGRIARQGNRKAALCKKKCNKKNKGKRKCVAFEYRRSEPMAKRCFIYTKLRTTTGITDIFEAGMKTTCFIKK